MSVLLTKISTFVTLIITVHTQVDITIPIMVVIVVDQLVSEDHTQLAVMQTFVLNTKKSKNQAASGRLFLF